MNNNIYKRILEVIEEQLEAFKTIVNVDNTLGLNVSVEDITNYLEFEIKEENLKEEINNIIITEGHILSILKIINYLHFTSGEYTLFINSDNIGTITYLIKITNEIYKELGINVFINIDYNDNYNQYLNEDVTIIGSNRFVEECKNDFSKANFIIV